LSTNFGALSYVNMFCFLMSTTTIVFMTSSWMQCYVVYNVYVCHFLFSVYDADSPYKGLGIFFSIPYVIFVSGCWVYVVMLMYSSAQC